MSSSNFGRQVKSIGRLRGASSWTRCDAFPVHIWTDSTDNKWAKIDITIADGRPETEQNARRVSSGYSKRRLGLNTRSPKSKQMKHFSRRPNVRMQVSSHTSSGSFFLWISFELVLFLLASGSTRRKRAALESSIHSRWESHPRENLVPSSEIRQKPQVSIVGPKCSSPQQFRRVFPSNKKDRKWGVGGKRRRRRDVAK